MCEPPAQKKDATAQYLHHGFSTYARKFTCTLQIISLNQGDGRDYLETESETVKL